MSSHPRCVYAACLCLLNNVAYIIRVRSLLGNAPQRILLRALRQAQEEGAPEASVPGRVLPLDQVRRNTTLAHGVRSMFIGS